MSESTADDGALYSVWDHLTAEQVDALHDLVAFLAIYRRRSDARLDVKHAIALLLVAYGLGHLPDVAASL